MHVARRRVLRGVDFDAGGRQLHRPESREWLAGPREAAVSRRLTDRRELPHHMGPLENRHHQMKADLITALAIGVLAVSAASASAQTPAPGWKAVVRIRPNPLPAGRCAQISVEMQAPDGYRETRLSNGE